MRMRTSNAVIATLALAAVLTAPAPAVADWLGLNVSNRGVGVSLGIGWDAWGDSWNDPNWNVDYATALNGYGDWMFVPGLGRVWQPFVSADWRPYMYGRWVETGLDWTWVSYEPWGFFPHHYGEWAYTDLGWVWVPGYDYRPANVVWMTEGDFIGWYPCGPRGWSQYYHGFHSGYENGYRQGYDAGWEDARYANFVRWRDIGADDIGRLAIAGDRLARTVTRTALRAIPNPPSLRDVERYAGRPLPHATLEQRELRIGGRTVTVARPAGVAPSIQAHARETVDRALAPQARERLRTVERMGAASATERRVPASERRGVTADRRGTQTPPANLERNATVKGQRPLREERVNVGQPERRQPARNVGSRSTEPNGSVERYNAVRQPRSAVPELRNERQRVMSTPPQTVTQQDTRRRERQRVMSTSPQAVTQQDTRRQERQRVMSTPPQAVTQQDTRRRERVAATARPESVRRNGSEVRSQAAARQPEVRSRESAGSQVNARETRQDKRHKKGSSKDQGRDQ